MEFLIGAALGAGVVFVVMVHQLRESLVAAKTASEDADEALQLAFNLSRQYEPESWTPERIRRVNEARTHGTRLTVLRQTR